MKSWNERGFTLVELMIVLIISMLLMGPAYQMFRSGSHSSLKGMKRIELVLEARRILRQVHDDLKRSCLLTSPEAQEFDLRDLFQGTDFPTPSFTFHSFPLHGDVKQVVSAGLSSGDAPRFANRITYRLLPDERPGSPFMKLIREEVAAPTGEKTSSNVLSKNVGVFSIQPVKFSTQVKDTGDQWCFLITLQIIDNTGGMLQMPQPGKFLGNGMGNCILTDFFDVVYSPHFNGKWNHQYDGVNWHSPIQGP